MAYYLTIQERNNFKPLDITQTEMFTRISKLKNNSYSLEEIDLFTSQFECEVELKRKLYESSVITLEDITKKISIRRKNKGELIKVMYDLVYQDNKKFLDTEYLRRILLTLQNDQPFLKKLLNHYSSTYDKEILYEIRAILMEYQDMELNIYETLNSFFDKTIFDQNGKIKYKSLHDLSMFIYTYLTQKGRSQIDIELSKISNAKELEELQKSFIKQEVTTNQKEKQVLQKVKTRKKNYELEGQISFF